MPDNINATNDTDMNDPTEMKTPVDMNELTRIFHRNTEFWGNLSESVWLIRRKA